MTGYWQITLSSNEKEAEILSDKLLGLSALSISYEDALDNPIYEPEPGTTPLWQETNVIALFAEDTDMDTIVATLIAQFSHLKSKYRVEFIPEKDWVRECLDQFKPINIAENLWITPSWCEPVDPKAINLILDPGLAFGTGSHATTALCLTYLAQADLSGKKVLDFGCGSGILAVAAALLGATHVDAVDICSQALEATQSNASINKVEHLIHTYQAEQFKPNEYEIIVANILAQPLVQLSSSLISMLAKQGTLVVSGILLEQIPMILAAYSSLQHVNTHTQEDWACIEFRN